MLKKGTKVKNKHTGGILRIRKVKIKQESLGITKIMYILDDNSRWESELFLLHWKVIE